MPAPPEAGAFPFAMVNPEMPTIASMPTAKILPTVDELFPETVMTFAPGPVIVIWPVSSGRAVGVTLVRSIVPFSPVLNVMFP